MYGVCRLVQLTERLDHVVFDRQVQVCRAAIPFGGLVLRRSVLNSLQAIDSCVGHIAKRGLYAPVYGYRGKALPVRVVAPNAKLRMSDVVQVEVQPHDFSSR